MANVLCVYMEVQLQNASADEPESVTVSYEDKPGIPGLAGIAAYLAPVPQVYQAVGRDYEYKRLGTVSLPAGIDLHTGRVIPLIRDRHRSRELIDDRYPKHSEIRLVLDNHSQHVSKETKRYLLSRPGRFELGLTPKHGSWPNLIEMFCSKIARSFPRHIRVASKAELIGRIYQGIEAMNQEPVVFRWRYNVRDIALT